MVAVLARKCLTKATQAAVPARLESGPRLYAAPLASARLYAASMRCQSASGDSSCTGLSGSVLASMKAAPEATAATPACFNTAISPGRLTPVHAMQNDARKAVRTCTCAVRAVSGADGIALLLVGNFTWRCACELGAKMLRTRHRMLQLRASSELAQALCKGSDDTREVHVMVWSSLPGRTLQWEAAIP